MGTSLPVAPVGPRLFWHIAEAAGGREASWGGISSWLQLRLRGRSHSLCCLLFPQGPLHTPHRHAPRSSAPLFPTSPAYPSPSSVLAFLDFLRGEVRKRERRIVGTLRSLSPPQPAFLCFTHLLTQFIHTHTSSNFITHRHSKFIFFHSAL